MNLPEIKENILADAHCTEGDAFLNKGDLQNAVFAYEKAVEADARNHRAYAGLGKALELNQQKLEAIECYGLAIEYAPEELKYKESLLELIRYYQIKKFNPKLKELITSCLTIEDLDCSNIGMIWHSLLKLDKEFTPIYKATHQNNYAYFKKVMLKAKDFSALTDPYFIKGLSKTLVFNLDYERFLTGLRHILLDSMQGDGLPLEEDDLIKIAASLSHYCFFTEYIFANLEEESAKIKELQTLIENGDERALTPLTLSVFACYKPLSGLKNIEAITKVLEQNDDTRAIISTQIKEPLSLKEIASKINSITSIDDEVSKKVQEQYEEFPYPRWNSYSKTIYNLKAEGFLEDIDAKILIAGCGTGKEAIELATVFPNADILAIDLSLTSLAYSTQKAEKYGAKNITFGHADILKLGELDQKFDYIASSGVLHHMKDPMAGWKNLIALLKPEGTMRVALYSELARRSISKAHQIIKDREYSNTAAEIKRFRADCPTLFNKHDFDNIKKFRDFYNMSECRDLLFHVQEHQYTIDKIKTSLDELGVEFLCFNLPNDVLLDYIKEFSTDETATDLDNWAKYEERNPDTFANMYQFWCKKP
jgi:2-polyprenyl-3-methyl-5-hydroxy-6-metoxy-1,4-benzoquinol methylase